MKEGIELIRGQLVVSLFLALLGAVVGSVVYVTWKKQLEVARGAEFSSKNFKARLYQVPVLLFALIFSLTFLLLHYFG